MYFYYPLSLSVPCYLQGAPRQDSRARPQDSWAARRLMLNIVDRGASFLQLQADAATQCLDGPVPEVIQWFAKLGNYGLQPSHIERDFWKLMNRIFPTEVQVYEVFVPVPKREQLGMEQKMTGLLLPHEVFAFLAKFSPHSTLHPLGVDILRVLASLGCDCFNN